MEGSPCFDLRRARLEDAEAIAEVNVAAGRIAWSAFLGEAALAGFDAPVERWRRRLAEATPREAWVAALDGEVVGFCLGRRGRAEQGGAEREPADHGPAEPETAELGPAKHEPAEITALYTHPRVWGRGVGRALLERTLEALRSEGAREAVLWTEERNERPRRVYERAGWRLDGARREREFLGRRIREVRYRLALAPSEGGGDRSGHTAGSRRATDTAGPAGPAGRGGGTGRGARGAGGGRGARS